jgi:hypothetical protein
MFRAALEALLEAAFARAGASVPSWFAPWIELVAEAGPMRPEGPLTHDLLLPAEDRAPQIALNVFSLDITGAAIDLIGAQARQLFAIDGSRWHGGIAWRDGQPRLKLYASSATDAILAHLGVTAPPGAMAVGVDLTRDGVSRVRSYHAPDPTLLVGFRAPWWPDTPQIARRIVTALGAERRTLNTIFETGADLEPALALGPRAIDPAWGAELAARVAAEGFVLRPAAHEIDVWADGRVEGDLLVAIGLPIK